MSVELPTTHEGLPIVAVICGPDEDNDYVAVRPGPRYQYLSAFARTPEAAVAELQAVLNLAEDPGPDATT